MGAHAPWNLEAPTSEASFISASNGVEALFSFFKVPKILQDFPSHRIFGRIYKALNIGKKIINYTV
jgi:hypothetical protein